MEADDPDLSTLFRVLAEPRRRVALEALCEHGSVALPDLAEVVAERSTGKRVDEISPEAVTRVYFSLYHNHVPELEEAGLVRYDQEEDRVVYLEATTEHLARVRTTLEGMLEG